jgi:hypothetical protein
MAGYAETSQVRVDCISVFCFKSVRNGFDFQTIPYRTVSDFGSLLYANESSGFCWTITCGQLALYLRKFSLVYLIHLALYKLSSGDHVFNH